MDQETSWVQELLDRAIAGEDGALGELLVGYRDRLLRMVELRLDRRLAGRVGASDIIQDVDIEVLRRFRQYVERYDMPFYVWLRLLTRQQLMLAARHHLGVEGRDPRRELRVGDGPTAAISSVTLADVLAGSWTSPSMVVDREQKWALLHDFLDRMSALDREILTLRHFEHLNNAEAAAELGLGESAASKRYIRALARLRESCAGLMSQPDCGNG